MRVAEIMSTQVDFVTPKTKVKDIARLIFGRGINGIPVCEGRKVVGFITEGDIVSKLYPTMAEYAEDPVNEGNFDEMEKKVPELFAMTADKIMSKNPTVVTADTKLLKAQSLMSTKNINRIAVVDDNGNLVGMLTKGDIFRAIVGDNLPLTDDQEYHDWQAKHYDMLIDWKKRLGSEIPELSALFRKNNVENVLDIGYGTGEHDFALAKEGFNVCGVESSDLMAHIARDKREKLPENLRRRLEFEGGWYPDVLANRQGKFDAAIFMGNAFPHLAHNSKKVLDVVSKALRPKNAVIVMQMENLEKTMKTKNRFLDLNFSETKHGFPTEHAFLRFYDPPKRKGEMPILTMSVMDFDGKKWKHRTLNSTQIDYIDKQKATKMLKELGFKKISFYGGEFFGSFIKSPFNPLQSDWLSVVAQR